jgi:hypothetical protein
VDVVKWVEDLEQFSELKEVWIKMNVFPRGGVIGECLHKCLQDLACCLR